ncbi:IclR family transcriptional regulator (plasmid) [Haloferacaceae archaeon DSL9]
MEHKAKHPVRTVEKSFAIIQALKELDGAGVTEIADTLGFGKSTVHNHLSTLEEHEYVVKEGDTYRLSLRFLELGGYTRNRMEFYKTAKPEIRRLAEETGELANMATYEYGRCVYLYRSKGSDAVDLDTYAGFPIAMHNTALGKSILAHLPDSEVHEILDVRGMEATTEHTITDRDELFAELQEIRERGYAFDREERLNGLRCVAAPIKHSEGRIWGSISVASPTRRMRDERFENEIPELVLGAANVIEINLTYS